MIWAQSALLLLQVAFSILTIIHFRRANCRRNLVLDKLHRSVELCNEAVHYRFEEMPQNADACMRLAKQQLQEARDMLDGPKKREV